MSRLNVDELAAAARRYKAVGAEIRALEEEKRELSATLVRELSARRRQSLDAGGITITRTSRRTGYSLEVLRARLKPGVFRRVTRVEPDAEAIKKELKAGTISEDDIKAAEVRGSEFPTVTEAA